MHRHAFSLVSFGEVQEHCLSVNHLLCIVLLVSGIVSANIIPISINFLVIVVTYIYISLNHLQCNTFFKRFFDTCDQREHRSMSAFEKRNALRRGKY